MDPRHLKPVYGILPSRGTYRQDCHLKFKFERSCNRGAVTVTDRGVNHLKIKRGILGQGDVESENHLKFRGIGLLVCTCQESPFKARLRKDLLRDIVVSSSVTVGILFKTREITGYSISRIVKS